MLSAKQSFTAPPGLVCRFCRSKLPPNFVHRSSRSPNAGNRACPVRRPPIRAIAAEAPTVPSRKLSFQGVESEEEFLQVLKAALQHPKAPDALFPLFYDFYQNYKSAVIGSAVPGADAKLVAQIMGSIADRVVHEFAEPFTFPCHHQRILKPYDYYAFGQNYVRTLLDFQNSVVGNLAVFDEMQACLDRQENVVILANHQTEADPAVWALLLERTHPRLATEVHYVAGDRVVTDPLCKPFSMGRNLFCVHSKKHIDDFPELKEAKQRTNRQTLVAMSRLLNQGGLLMWIAPSGGRDRPDAQGRWLPDRFDPTAVELMRQLLAKAKPRGHLFPLAMHSGEMMPPPPSHEKSVGERRLTRFVGTGAPLAGLSAGPELDVAAVLQGIDEADPKQRQVRLAEAAYNTVLKLYTELDAAIRDPAKRSGFVQPWLE